MRLIVPLALLGGVVGLAWGEWELTGLEVKPFVDLRAETGDPVPDTLQVMQAEVNVRLFVNHDGEEFMAVAYAPPVFTEMSGRGRQMHFSNLYGVFNFGVEKPKLKVGQFVVPFGTLAEYDTHPLILQTPYARTIGIRLDRGFELEEVHQETNYRLAVVSGNGRNRYDNGFAVLGRAAKDHESGDDTYRVGTSLAYGKNMPVFEPMPDPIPMGEESEPEAWVDKVRLALDLDWLHGRDNIRAELVVGWDDGDFVNGQWIHVSHPFSYQTELIIQADRWLQPSGLVLGAGAELHHRLDDLSGLRLTYQHRRAEPAEGPRTLDSLTLGWYRNFSLDF